MYNIKSQYRFRSRIWIQIEEPTENEYTSCLNTASAVEFEFK